jgi:hypothetical protein
MASTEPKQGRFPTLVMPAEKASTEPKQGAVGVAAVTLGAFMLANETLRD